MLSSFISRSPILFYTGAGLVLLGFVLVPMLWLDTRTVTGLPAWAKPIKFALSTGIFLLTMGWLLGDLQLTGRTATGVAATFAAVMWGETLLIALQAARGTTSHFNYHTAFDSVVFMTMATLIFVNTVLLGCLLWVYAGGILGAANLPPAYRWGIVGSLVLLLFSSWVGTLMVRNGAHTVGAHDGGPGLPLLGWSVTAGDLRWAHFLGIHAIHLVLLAYYLLPTRTLQAVGVGLVLLVTTAGTGALFALAQQGKPVVKNRISSESRLVR